MDNLPAVVETSLDNTLRYVTFNIGEELFGVDIMCVESIIQPQEITAVPRTPDYFLGIINLRGDVISIIDMRTMFGIEKQGDTPDTRIVVIRSNTLKIGMVVDDISAIEIIDNKEIQKSPSIATSEQQKFISGSFKLLNKKILLILLHDKIIDAKDFITQEDFSLTQESIETKLVKKTDWVKKIPLVGFSIGHEQYTVESTYVEEIIFLPELTIIPDVEEFVEGIFYLRESVVPVIHLGNRMGLGKGKITSDNQVIILKNKLFGIQIGLIVDDISEIFFINEDELTNTPINLNKTQSDHLKGVFKMNRDEESLIVMLLNLEKLFTGDEQEKLRELDLIGKQEDIADKEQENLIGILDFMIANERYAIKVSETNEIIRIRNIVPVPKSPPFIKGIINLRGDVISIVNLSLLVDKTRRELTKNAKILIVSANKEVAGLLVEKVIGIRKVKLSSFEPPSDLIKRKGNIFIKGIGKVEDSGEIVVLMDIETTLLQAQTEVEEDEDLMLIQQELEYLELEDTQAGLVLPETT